MKWLEIITKLLPWLCAGLRWLTGRKPNRGSVLIVEDDDHDALVLSLAVQKLGHQCQVARTVAEAKLLLANETFALAFVDLRLPGVSGTELLQAISADAPSTRTIIVCGEPGDLRGESSKGWPHVMIPKPVTVSGLREAFSMLGIK